MSFIQTQRQVLLATRYRLLRLNSTGNARLFSATTASVKRAQHISWHHNRRKLYGVAGIAFTGAVLFSTIRVTDGQAEEKGDRNSLSKIPLSKLISGWIENMYNFLSHIPILSSVTDAIIMRTFFNQFLGGESISECIPKIQALRQQKIGTLLGYNVEADLNGSKKDPQLIAQQIEHIIASIEAQGKLARQFWLQASSTGGDNRCWVRIKVTGLLPDPTALYHGSNAILQRKRERGLDNNVPYPGLPQDGDWEAALGGVIDVDRLQLMALRSTLETIASKARENNVRIVIDAEQTWYQPVIDSLTDELMQKYNSLDGPATCIASFQAYLRRYPVLLDQQIKRADEKGYKLLFKQVRGAYMEGLARRADDDTKLVLSGQAAGAIAFAQLYGMKDDLTNKITGSITSLEGFPLVVKSMSYGELKECLPFLARRATENKAILEGRGGAVAERMRLGRELRRRLLPFESSSA
ncbi:proline oxidase Put1 [Aspergillus luchuensis]|uniref:Proline dehydrogenase n=1 Tax=Aspergillus kawachii TaxID=1069201 RepID=A0A146F6V3_ASPKA|nr:proline oxidase Put1 [Aspergillus luchuensis]